MTKVRPTVVFDASNADHRRYAWEMIKSRSFKNCPYIWALNEGYDNVIDMIYRKMTEWYAEQEFDLAEKPQMATVIPLDKKQG